MNQLTEFGLTDLTVSLILLFYAANGWRKGFFRTLLGPLAFLVCFIGGHIYFLKTYNFWISSLIVVLGPFLLTITLSIFLNIWNRHLDRGLSPFILSRLLAAAAGIVWGGCFVVLGLVILMILPIHFQKWEKIRGDIAHSYSYKMIEKFIKDKIPHLEGIESAFDASQDSEKFSELKQTPEFQAVYTDPKMNAILSDETTARQIKDKDIPGLLTNPKIIAAWQDLEVAKKILRLQETMEKRAVKVPEAASKETNSAF